MGTLFAFIFAILYSVWNWHSANANGLMDAHLAITLIGGLFLAISPLLFCMTLTPLQRAETKISPWVTRLFWSGFDIKGASFIFLLFPVFSLGIAIFFSGPLPLLLGIAWILLFGIAIDAVALWLRKLAELLDPLQAIQQITKSTQAQIHAGDAGRVFEGMDVLTECAVKAIHRHDALFTRQTLGQMILLCSDQVRMHDMQRVKGESSDEDAKESIGIFLAYFLQRLERIYQSAKVTHNDAIATDIISSCGKTVFITARYSLAPTSLPLNLLGRLADEAQKAGDRETPVKISCLLLSLGKSIITDIPPEAVNFREVYMGIVARLEEIALETFRRDKSTNISALKKPFDEIRVLLAKEGLVQRDDVQIVLRDIVRVIEDLTALEAVLVHIPLPPMEEDEFHLEPEDEEEGSSSQEGREEPKKEDGS